MVSRTLFERAYSKSHEVCALSCCILPGLHRFPIWRHALANCGQLHCLLKHLLKLTLSLDSAPDSKVVCSIDESFHHTKQPVAGIHLVCSNSLERDLSPRLNVAFSRFKQVVKESRLGAAHV